MYLRYFLIWNMLLYSEGCTIPDMLSNFATSEVSVRRDLVVVVVVVVVEVVVIFFRTNIIWFIPYTQHFNNFTNVFLWRLPENLISIQGSCVTIVMFKSWFNRSVHAFAWCRLASSNELGQCQPRSSSPYGVIIPTTVLSIFLFRPAQDIWTPSQYHDYALRCSYYLKCIWFDLWYHLRKIKRRKYYRKTYSLLKSLIVINCTRWWL